MKSIKFSVIMPCYNSKEYVKYAVESIIRQRYQNWELIAINDGSRDNTLAILNEFSDKDDRIKVFSKENGGYATAVNFGLDKVEGDYFLMMGSDDALSENLFLEIVNAVSEKDYLPDMIGFCALKFKNGEFFERDTVSEFYKSASMSDATISEFEEQYPQNSKILFIRDTAKCFKTAKRGNLYYFGKYGFDADGAFSTLFTHKCQSFLTLPIDGYFWTVRGNSVSANVNPKIDFDRMKVWMKYLSAIEKEKAQNLSSQEHKYVLYPFNISIDILNKKSNISLIEFFLMNKALRRSIKVAREKKINLSFYKKILDDNPIKRFVFLTFPIIWLMRHGFINK